MIGTVAALNPSISEADFQRLIIDLAKLHRWACHHSRPARMLSGRWATPIDGHPGFVDLVLAQPSPRGQQHERRL